MVFWSAYLLESLRCQQPGEACPDYGNARFLELRGRHGQTTSHSFPHLSRLVGHRDDLCLATSRDVSRHDDTTSARQILRLYHDGKLLPPLGRTIGFFVTPVVVWMEGCYLAAPRV
jgi:hypothetical protein